MVGSVVRAGSTRERPVRRAGDQRRLVAGFDTRGPPPYDFRYVAGPRRPRSRQRDRSSSATGPASSGVTVGETIAVLARRGPRPAARRRHIHVLRAACRFGGQGLAGDAADDGARRCSTSRTAGMQISVRVERPRPGRGSCARDLERALGARRARWRRRPGARRRRSAAAQGARRRPRASSRASRCSSAAS